MGWYPAALAPGPLVTRHKVLPVVGAKCFHVTINGDGPSVHGIAPSKGREQVSTLGGSPRLHPPHPSSSRTSPFISTKTCTHEWPEFKAQARRIPPTPRFSPHNFPVSANKEEGDMPPYEGELRGSIPARAANLGQRTSFSFLFGTPSDFL